MLDETIEGVRTITLQRHPMNTLDLAAVTWLGAAFEAHPADMPLVLTGADGVFCAGVDSKAFMGYAPAQRLEMARAITAMTARLLAIRAPVVAALSGHALGGGLVLALCCDHRIATDAEAAKFGLFEAKAGIAFPSGPGAIVHHELPAPLLRQLTLSCRAMSASDLLRHAVFDEMAEPERLLALAQERARELAAFPGFRAVKAQMRAGLAEVVRRLADEGREEPFEAR
jgi:enoyl-CoA hydratase/carnithine racemase